MKTACLYLLMLVTVLQGCIYRTTMAKSPPGFDLNNPVKFNMPESIHEISGICFYNGNPDTVYAIQDEDGKVFRLAWGDKNKERVKFARGGDYEDVTIINDKIYVLKSNGSIYSFPVKDAVYSEIDDAVHWKNLLPKGEYEAMYGDASSGSLYVLCKSCKTDNDKEQVTGYILSSLQSNPEVRSFNIKVTDRIKEFTGKIKRGFKPSALAKNPLTNEWYVVSSVNKILVLFDNEWQFKALYPLNGNVFNQPEGIAFDSAGNLYISNEGDELSAGNILKFEKTATANAN